jgi:hypothetical protein
MEVVVLVVAKWNGVTLMVEVEEGRWGLWKQP